LNGDCPHHILGQDAPIAPPSARTSLSPPAEFFAVNSDRETRWRVRARICNRQAPSQDPTTPRLGRVAIPMGRVLRRFSIAALPQLINVLRREMSVVGPRLPLRPEVEAYNGDVQRRLLVKPGINGLSQVSGRSDLPWDKAVRLDLAYVDNWVDGRRQRDHREDIAGSLQRSGARSGRAHDDDD
jgi:hypothetical protein